MKSVLIIFGIMLLLSILASMVYAYCQVDLSCVPNCMSAGYSYDECRMYCQVCS